MTDNSQHDTELLDNAEAVGCGNQPALCRNGILLSLAANLDIKYIL